jgi:hypothetical protein
MKEEERREENRALGKLYIHKIYTKTRKERTRVLERLVKKKGLSFLPFGQQEPTLLSGVERHSS